MPARAQTPAPAARAAARARILSAALRLFRERGVEHVTFGDVARKARASRPLVYFYFPTRHALILEAHLAGLQGLHARFRAAAATGRTGLAATESIGRAFLAYHDEAPDLFHICSLAAPPRRGSPSDDPLVAAVERETQAVMDLFVGVIERGQRDGSISRAAGAPLVIALSLWGLTHGLSQLAHTQREALTETYRIPPPALLEAGIALLTRALAGRA